MTVDSHEICDSHVRTVVSNRCLYFWHCSNRIRAMFGTPKTEKEANRSDILAVLRSN